MGWGLGNLVNPIQAGIGAAFGGSGGSGGDFLGDMLTGGAISNAKSVSETNEMQMRLAREQMGFQERMSSTAYQRAMSDMRTAGLNPMLAFSQGGASTPPGSMATLSAPRKGDIGAGLFNTAKAIATQVPEIQNTQSQTRLNVANEKAAVEEAVKIRNQAKETATSAYVREQQGRQEKNAADISDAEQPARKAIAPYKPALEAIGQILGVANTGSQVFRNSMRGMPAPQQEAPSQYQMEKLYKQKAKEAAKRYR